MAKLPTAALVALHNIARYRNSKVSYQLAHVDQRVVRRLEREGYITITGTSVDCTPKGLDVAPASLATVL